MDGALGLDTPEALYKKFQTELEALRAEPENTYAALNAIRDAYHLREWIYNSWLKTDPSLLQKILGSANRKELDWNKWVNNQFTDFQILREICNGSKHLNASSSNQVQESYEAGWDKQPWDSPWDATGLIIILHDGSHISVLSLLNDVNCFWNNFIEKYK